MFRRKKCPKDDEQIFPDHVVSLDFNSFEDFVCRYSLSAVDFYANWCKPCRDMIPRFRRLSKLYKGKVAFGRINVEENEKIASEHKITSVPSVIFFSYGKRLKTVTGLRSVGDMKKIIDELLKSVER